MKIAVVGATGMVGQVMLKVLEERNFPVTELIAVASGESVGKKVQFRDQKCRVVSIEQAIQMRPKIAIFSAGGDISLKYAPQFETEGTTVIDNSSAWRMDPARKLIVPEINARILSKHDKIIANPNCSTIQLVMALYPLHLRYHAKRVVVSTYQSISGTGTKAVEQFENERRGRKGEMAYPYQIDQNCLPHCDVFLENDYTKEEMKLTNETKKIMQSDGIKVTATAVRVPVLGGHSEAVNVEFEEEFEIAEVRNILNESPGIILQDLPDANIYPMPLFVHHKDEVFVGRVRRDETQPKTLNMWVVADNLRKGAATNAIQIAEYLVANKLV